MTGGLFKSELAIRNSEEAFTRLCVHDRDTGGAFAAVVGAKGTGKTTLLLRILERCHLRDGGGFFVPETIIWRARPGMVDVWAALLDPKYPWVANTGGTPLRREVVIHHHAEDFVTADAEEGGPLDGMADRFRPYWDCAELYRNLLPGAVNVVVEPSGYHPSEEFLQVVTRRCLVSEKKLRRMDLDTPLWWVEFLHYLLYHKQTEPLAVFMDEADEIFTRNPTGLRYHFQAVFGSSARDFRKKQISFYMTLHNWADADWAVTSKANFYLWLRGRSPPHFSQAHKYAASVATMNIGQVIIEHQGFGGMVFERIPFRQKVIVQYRKKVVETTPLPSAGMAEPVTTGGSGP